MDVNDMLCEAMRERRTVTIRRSKDPPGTTRTGEPYAIYESSAGNILFHLYQTAGYTSSAPPPPKWRPFTLRDIDSVEVHDTRFDVQADYNPANRKFYPRFICRVE